MEMNHIEELREEYLRLMHAVQTGVAAKMQYAPDEITPKHLRAGINSAMVQHTAMIRLLIKKGIITDEEYFESLVSAAKEEVQMYEKELSEILMTPIHLE